MENTVDGLMEVRRTLHTVDNISIKLAVHRAVEWKTNTNRTSGSSYYGTQVFKDKFSMYITVVDNNFRDIPYLKADLYNQYYGSKTLEHTQGTLNQFILRELAQSFDPAKVIDTFERRVKYIKDLNLATAKYL
jgi:hypothetical protein